MKKRAYKTIKWVLNEHIKNKVQSLWTWENDNFTCLFNEFKDRDRIYTSTQLLKILKDGHDN
tara:strand:+ start:1454 stop:1639 length:186 start_codon:yes stop_codon:yes gene_type:complete